VLEAARQQACGLGLVLLAVLVESAHARPLPAWGWRRIRAEDYARTVAEVRQERAGTLGSSFGG
jgi:hypothetical protein